MSENTISVEATVDGDMQNRLANVGQLLADAETKLNKAGEYIVTAENSATTATENYRLSTVALAAAQVKADEISAVATQAIAAKTQIVDDQAVIAVKSEHIQQAQAHADKVRAELDRVLTSTTQQATEAEGLKARTQAAMESASNLLVEIKTTKAASEEDHSVISGMREEVVSATALTKNLAERSSTIEARISAYERQLEELKLQCESQLQTITDLLPGATSAGLAHAFNERRKTFLGPVSKWQKIFISSVLILVVLACSSLWQVYTATSVLTYDELLRLWLARLPVAGALIWLALYASHESALAKRLEEDYGYKAAIASSFQGFHMQMSAIDEKVTLNAPLAQLCSDTLATIASPPGRIYDKHQLMVSPTTELTDAIRMTSEAITTRALSTTVK